MPPGLSLHHPSPIRQLYARLLASDASLVGGHLRPTSRGLHMGGWGGEEVRLTLTIQIPRATPLSEPLPRFSIHTPRYTRGVASCRDARAERRRKRRRLQGVRR